MGERLAKKLLLIGWDAADWKLISPLVDQGLMPALEKLINNGVMGNLATLQPMLSPLVWNSIATGKRPDKHGILGFEEPDPLTGGVRPAASASRKVKALWNILTQRGFRTHVVHWYAGHPAEPINGVCISPLYSQPLAPSGQPWPMPPGTVHPDSLRETLAELRLHPAELGAPELLPFVPRAAQVDQQKDRHLAVLAGLVAETCSIHNATTWILQNEPWDFLAVCYTGIDHFCHAFMPFHPPRLEQAPEDQYELYKDVVTGAYRLHDMMLETLVALAGPQTTLMLVSDHGFHSDHLRPKGIPEEPAGPAVWHRPFGVICLAGPHIRKDERIYGATVLDVTPTALTLFGLPVGEDMDGRVLVQALEEAVQPERIPSWESQPGACGMHPPEQRMDPVAARALIDQFVALGYVQKPTGQDQAQAVARTVRESKYNLARVFLDSRRAGQALPLLEELAAEQPQELRFLRELVLCQFILGRNEEAKRILEGLPILTEHQPWADLALGVLRYQEGNSAEALEHLLRAEQADPRMPTLHLRIGSVYLRIRRWEEAERAFEKALSIDGDSPGAHLGRTIVRLHQRRNEEAAQDALTAVGLQHFFPQGHYHLGVALARLGHFERAALAFETALSMQPGLLNAHRWLAGIYGRSGGDLARAAHHRRMANELRRQREAARHE